MINAGWIAVAALASFLFGTVLVLQAEVDLNARRVERGLFYHDGHVYRLVEIKP